MDPNSYAKLIVNRVNEIATIHAGVCDTPKTLHYLGNIYPEVSGIYEFAAESFRKHFWPGVDLNDERVKEIDWQTLDAILLNHTSHMIFFDFFSFSLDVEGAELAVLQSIDFDRVEFGIICAGYIFLEQIGSNYWFSNGRFYEIYQHLVY